MCDLYVCIVGVASKPSIAYGGDFAVGHSHCTNSFTSTKPSCGKAHKQRNVCRNTGICALCTLTCASTCFAQTSHCAMFRSPFTLLRSAWEKRFLMTSCVILGHKIFKAVAISSSLILPSRFASSGKNTAGQANGKRSATRECCRTHIIAQDYEKA